MAKTTKKNGRAKPAKRAAAKRKPAGRKTGKARGEVRVRMYRQGLGDCFLLTFPKPNGGEFVVLIDCGVILGTPDAGELMKAVVADIAQTTKNHLDVLVATHEHWDHVSGFDQAKELFDKFKVDQVWLAWTENPDDATAKRLRRDRAHKLAALWLGIGQMRQRLAATGAGPEANEALDRAAQVLSFFGIDPDEDQPPAEGFGAAAAKAGGKTGAAMDWVRNKTAKPRFWKPGDLIELDEAGGVRVYVLGPPTDHGQLFKALPTRSGKETYEEKMQLAAAERTYFGAAFGAADAAGVQPDFDQSLPFDPKYQIQRDKAKGTDLFDHYLGSRAADPEAWRRIDDDWMAGAAEFALQLDSYTNNTSLALAFELPDGRVLLFPGDAQVGNWESWHQDEEGNKRVWKVTEKGHEVTAEALLNRTVLYKVGHHGSHNATLREQGLEMMTDPTLTAMVPVDVYIAHEKKHWKKMPFNPLMQRLTAKTNGRMLQADQALAAPTGKKRAGKRATPPGAPSPFLGSVVDAAEQLEVTGAGGAAVKRPLYVDYFLPPS